MIEILYVSKSGETPVQIFQSKEDLDKIREEQEKWEQEQKEHPAEQTPEEKMQAEIENLKNAIIGGI